VVNYQPSNLLERVWIIERVEGKHESVYLLDRRCGLSDVRNPSTAPWCDGLATIVLVDNSSKLLELLGGKILIDDRLCGGGCCIVLS
jgi:hypothetical protein